MPRLEADSRQVFPKRLVLPCSGLNFRGLRFFVSPEQQTPGQTVVAKSLLPAAGVFVLVLLVAPIVELSGGASPWPDTGTKPRQGFMEGGWLRASERALSDRSVLAAGARPAYQEVVHSLFGLTNEKIVAGKDGWLFLQETSLDYPGPGGEDKVRAHAELIGRLSAWWRDRGTLLLAVPVPNKETLFPDRLPERARVRPMLPTLLEALTKAGAQFIDLRPALDPVHGLTFLPNDSHWTPLGARRAAEAVGADVRARYPNGVPGAVLEAEFFVAPEKAHFGDLQRMLGFRPGSDAERAFDAKTGWISVRGKRGAQPTAEPDGSPVVVCGTSFSHSFGFAEMVAAAVGRVVVDATVAGKGPTLRLLELAERVRGGKAAAPAIIVWEFPEEHLFTRPFEFLEPLRDFAREADASDGFDASAGEPLAIADRRLAFIKSDDAAAAMVRGVGLASSPGARPDPHVVYTCATPPTADGTSALEIVVRTETATTLKIFLDYGAGRFDEATAIVRRTAGAGVALRSLIPLTSSGAGATLRRVRVDPANDVPPFEIDPPRLIRRGRTP